MIIYRNEVLYEKIKSDMPGDVVEIGPDQKRKSRKYIFKTFC